jgi:hypothetical protein
VLTWFMRAVFGVDLNEYKLWQLNTRMLADPDFSGRVVAQFDDVILYSVFSEPENVRGGNLVNLLYRRSENGRS